MAAFTPTTKLGLSVGSSDEEHNNHPLHTAYTAILHVTRFQHSLREPQQLYREFLSEIPSRRQRMARRGTVYSWCDRVGFDHSLCNPVGVKKGPLLVRNSTPESSGRISPQRQ